MSERRDPAHQFDLEQAYNEVYHIMVKLQDEVSWWQKACLRLAITNVVLFLIMLFLVWR